LLSLLAAAALKFGRGNKSIVGMTSSEGEGFAFRSMVPVEGAVEVWMTGVEAEMRRTLAVLMKEGEQCAGSRSIYVAYPTDRVLQNQQVDLWSHLWLTVVCC
jgi:hypothetical protein